MALKNSNKISEGILGNLLKVIAIVVALPGSIVAIMTLSTISGKPSPTFLVETPFSENGFHIFGNSPTPLLTFTQTPFPTISPIHTVTPIPTVTPSPTPTSTLPPILGLESCSFGQLLTKELYLYPFTSIMQFQDHSDYQRLLTSGYQISSPDIENPNSLQKALWILHTSPVYSVGAIRFELDSSTNLNMTIDILVQELSTNSNCNYGISTSCDTDFFIGIGEDPFALNENISGAYFAVRNLGYPDKNGIQKILDCQLNSIIQSCADARSDKSYSFVIDKNHPIKHQLSLKIDQMNYSFLRDGKEYLTVFPPLIHYPASLWIGYRIAYGGDIGIRLTCGQ
jgi:hypothetical protein